VPRDVGSKIRSELQLLQLARLHEEACHVAYGETSWQKELGAASERRDVEAVCRDKDVDGVCGCECNLPRVNESQESTECVRRHIL